jgi:hypothetical protein
MFRVKIKDARKAREELRLTRKAEKKPNNLKTRKKGITLKSKILATIF